MPMRGAKGVPAFASGGASGPVVTTLKFLDAKTGKPIAEKALPSGTFLGLDATTGQTTPATAMPGGATAEYSTLIDAETSNVLLYDSSDAPSAGSAVVSLSQGTVLWKQHDQHGSLVPLSLHNGVVYGIEAAEVGSTDGKQLAVKEADGSPAGNDYELSPLDFTADGAPLFAEVSSDMESDASKVTVGVGHSA